MFNPSTKTSSCFLTSLSQKMEMLENTYKQKILKETNHLPSNDTLEESTRGCLQSACLRWAAPGSWDLREQPLPTQHACGGCFLQGFVRLGSQNVLFPPFSNKHIILSNPLRICLICDIFLCPPHSTVLQKIPEVQYWCLSQCPLLFQ